MNRQLCFCSLVLVSIGVGLTGCMPKMTIEEMRANMPQRPAELDRLNDFVGNWEFSGTADMAMLNEPLTMSGTNEAKWDGDGWFLVSRGNFNMGGLGDMTGMETWVYDSHDKVYRSTWVDSMGSLGTGSARYNEDTRTWRMRATSHGPMGKTVWKSTVRMVDANTMEFEGAEYAMGGLMKTMEMSGTSRRR